MSGIGERFLKYGISTPKPLIKVDGKPIIHHVIDMFPEETNFTFICNNDHLSNKKFNMEKIIRSKIPEAKIIGIKAHKLGPIFAISQILDQIKDDEPLIINYCDFTCYWDYKLFKKIILDNEYDGSIPAYRNFHPHSLWGNNYAFIKEDNFLLKDIQEKLPFTDNKMKEFASSGTYYFKSGKLLKESISYCFKNNLTVNDEFYVSTAYNYLIKNKMKVYVHEIEHFMQWGTPEDLNEYISWSEIFKNYKKLQKNNKDSNHAIIMPMAGFGQRFIEEGYHKPKPLLNVKGVPMFKAVLDDLPIAGIYVFVLRKNMKNLDIILKNINLFYPKSIIKILDKETDGQAISCLEGLKALEEHNPTYDGPITFASCDTGFIYNEKKFSDWIKSGKSDVLAWSATNHPTAVRFPNFFGWINTDQKNIKSVSVKKPLKNPKIDNLIVGTFTFKRKDIFKKSIESLIKRKEMVNGEFYLDSSINDAIQLGYNCEIFKVDNMISWGTPNDLETFKYWEKCFKKWKSHEFSGF